MSIEVVLWLIDVLPGLAYFFFVMSLIFLILVILAGVGDDEEKQIRNNIVNNYKKIFGIPVLIIFLTLFLPSKETMYMMLGAHYIKNSTLPTKVEMAIEKKIDGYLADAGEKK